MGLTNWIEGGISCAVKSLVWCGSGPPRTKFPSILLSPFWHLMLSVLKNSRQKPILSSISSSKYRRACPKINPVCTLVLFWRYSEDGWKKLGTSTASDPEFWVAFRPSKLTDCCFSTWYGRACQLCYWGLLHKTPVGLVHRLFLQEGWNTCLAWTESWALTQAKSCLLWIKPSG